MTITAVLVTLFCTALVSVILQGDYWLLPIKIGLLITAFALSFQGIFTLFWMLYGWEDPNKLAADAPPKIALPPQTTFSIIIPARFESEVIGTTLASIANIEYPAHLWEVLVVCKSDDKETLRSARAAVAQLRVKNFKVLSFTSLESNKPSALNFGLKAAKYDVIGVFDAEDEPQTAILQVVNTVFLTKQPSAVQGGVQLTNLRTTWFSALNVLEYYFWYKSALHLFSRMGVVPLGGNTVFIKKQVLTKLGGWNTCLTEDAEMGLRLSSQNYPIQIVYDPDLVTREESPGTLASLVKQRTRWNQGFLQILLERKWQAFHNPKKRLFALYFLVLAQLNALNFVLVMISLATFFIDLPVIATLLVMYPFYLLVLQLVVQILGYTEFSKDFHQRMSVLVILTIVLTFVPYQMVLAFSALRAVLRHTQQKTNWEKTTHLNLHRTPTTNGQYAAA